MCQLKVHEHSQPNIFQSKDNPLKKFQKKKKFLTQKKKKKKGKIECHLNLITNIDNESVWSGLDSDPRSVFSDLKTGDLVIREQQRHPSGVRVGRQPQGQLWLRAFWVIVHPQTRSYLLPTERILKKSLFQSQVYRKYPQQSSTQLHHFPSVLLYHFSVLLIKLQHYLAQTQSKKNF